MQGKTLLVIGAGVEAEAGIIIAKTLGLTLVIVDGNPAAAGLAHADHKIIESTYHGEAIATKALRLTQKGCTIDGVIAMCADVPLSVAIVAQALNLPGLDVESSRWVADKLLMKQRLQKMGIPIPRFFPVESANRLAEISHELCFPLIVKPVDSRGARGVQYIENHAQLNSAFHIAQEESPTGRVMAEEFLAGPQISTETLIDNGQCYTLGFCDRNYEWLEKTKPFIIENGGDSPSALGDNDKHHVIQTVESAALALNIHSGVAKGDMVLTKEGPKVIEIAGRLSGGYFSTTQIPLATGVNFVEHAIALALGQKLDPAALKPTRNRGVAIRYLSPRSGKVTRIDGIADAEASEGVVKLSILINPGEQITDITNHTQRSGFVICTGKDKREAIERAIHALAKIHICYA